MLDHGPMCPPPIRGDAGSVIRPGRLLRLERPTPAMYAPVLVAVAYYLGARVGFSLAIESQPVSMLWPPNAILLGALLLAPPRMWAVIIGVAFPAHLAVELASDVPLTMILCWYISNVTQAVLG